MHQIGPMIVLRPARPDEAAVLTALCLRSKAVWGYDAAFMAACRPELTLTAADIAGGDVQVAEREAGVVGLCEISVEEGLACLEKLFVEPDQLAGGVGADPRAGAAAAEAPVELTSTAVIPAVAQSAESRDPD